MAGGAASKAVGLPVGNVIFDFGNVLIRWLPGQALAGRYSRLSIEAMLDNGRSGFFDGDDLLDAGASCEEALEWVREHKGSPWDEMFACYCSNFEDALAGPVPGARKLIEDLKAAGIGVWGLSNWSAQLFPLTWERSPILHTLDGFVVSGRVRMRKPDPAIFEYALGKFGIDAGGCVFVDDMAVNVEGANKVGIRGIRFTDPYLLRTALIGLGLDIPQVACGPEAA
ncbi:HAD family hydrolase [Bifidobacterium favimelis]|uniref:HAD family phosphatase n=1 Tax=Bifidobacterium favimelis TaxID=3122979 RepID=A0ABU8ZME9_9BIFI